MKRSKERDMRYDDGDEKKVSLSVDDFSHQHCAHGHVGNETPLFNHISAAKYDQTTSQDGPAPGMDIPGSKQVRPQRKRFFLHIRQAKKLSSK